MKNFGRRTPPTDQKLTPELSPRVEEQGVADQGASSVKPTAHSSLLKSSKPAAMDHAASAKLPPSPSAADLAQKQVKMHTNQTDFDRVRDELLKQIDVAAAAQLARDDLQVQIESVIGDVALAAKVRLNLRERAQMTKLIVDDMLGLGPIEPLLAMDEVTDILVNGPNQVYVEISGKLQLTDVKFRDNQHVTNIAQRIANTVGRRIDESSPLVDARLQDGSRVNIIMPPLALTGTTISIRKFSRDTISLDRMVAQDNISYKMSEVIKVAAACGLNILISGGTGSGKTTLLNALSQLIDSKERIVTIEDAAELQLQQPHVVRLETRPPNLEGEGEITIRDLVKNALRMRPDRIVIGEVRGAEVLDMLQAMNTGHDGSLATIHANQPRDALMRLENMAAMAASNFNSEVIKRQITGALNMIIQTERMRDGKRRVTSIMEVVGFETGVILTQELYAYKYERENSQGMLVGQFVCSGVRPHFETRAQYYGLQDRLTQAMRIEKDDI